MKQNGECTCRGNNCRINHSKHRWTALKSDNLLNRLKISISSNTKKYICTKCDQKCDDEENFKIHIARKHDKILKFVCQQCDNNFNREKDYKNHIRNEHRSKFGCQPCDNTFQNEEDLIRHMEIHHESSKLESTFYNPSASS